MILRFFIFVFGILLFTGCKHETLSNNLDELDLICGEGSSSPDEDQFIRLKDQGNAFEKRDIQVFSESESGKIEVVDFSLTPRSCIKIKPKLKVEFHSKLTFIYKNQLAGQIDPNKVVRNIPLVSLEDCGEHCAAYPSCGLIDAPRNISGKSAVVLKVPSTKGEKINATLENNSFNTVLNINEKNCFLLPKDAKGTLRLQDSLGNFLEKSADETFRIESVLSVAELNLRGPLNVSERLCKEKPLSYRIDGDKCVPKSFRYICEDSPTNPGLRVMALNFLRLDCKKMEESLQKETIIDFSFKDLFNAEIFSGLVNLRELDLSVNYISNLSDLLGVTDLNVLNLERGKAPFDLSSLSAFQNLKKLMLAGTSLINTDQMKVISSLEELSITDIPEGLLSKTPNIKRLILSGQNVDLGKLSILDKLEYLEISVRGLKNLSALKNLTSLKQINFSGAEINPDEHFPYVENLEALNFSSTDIPDLTQISGSKKLESIEYYFGSDPPHVELPSLPYVTSVKITCENGDLGCLTPFPNVKNLKLQINEISLENFPVIESLRSLSIISDDAIGINGLGVLNNLETLEFRFGPKLDELIDFPAFPKLINLYVGSSGNPDISDLSWLKKVPNLKNLKLSVDASESLKEAILPSGLESLDLTSWGLQSFELLKPLHEMKELKLDISGSDLEANQDFALSKVVKVDIRTGVSNFLKFPVFPNATNATLDLQKSDEVDSNAIARIAKMFPTLQTLKLLLYQSNMQLLKQFHSAKTIMLYSTDADLSDLPYLPSVTTFKFSSPQLEDLNGIANFPELKNIEFINGNQLKTLQTLIPLKKLEKIIGSRFIRKNFPTATSCPETPDSPPALQDYCSDIMMPIVRMFGPATF